MNQNLCILLGQPDWKALLKTLITATAILFLLHPNLFVSLAVVSTTNTRRDTRTLLIPLITKRQVLSVLADDSLLQSLFFSYFVCPVLTVRLNSKREIASNASCANYLK